MNTTTAVAPVSANDFHPGQTIPWMFKIVLYKERGQPELMRMQVSRDHLSEAINELWRDGGLRKGLPDLPLEEMTITLKPKFIGKGPRCDGFVLEAVNPTGSGARRDYGIAAFYDPAYEAAQQLVSQNVIAADDTFYYEVLAERSAAAEAASEITFQTEAKRQPLLYQQRELQPLLDSARMIGAKVPGSFAVFYTAEAYKKSETFARKGAQRHPAEETGAVLLGHVCSCPASGELFVVIVDALEVHDAEQKEFSLNYTSKTWARIQMVLKARQSKPGQESIRVLGQCHGHNFLPGGGAPPCELCSKVDLCTRSSVFVSSDDRTWSRAVFAHQPWQVCHIYGLNARRENVQSLFTLQDNSLKEREFYVLKYWD